MFRPFEQVLRPTEIPPEAPPPLLGEGRALLRFYWHYARQARWLIPALCVTGLAVATLELGEGDPHAAATLLREMSSTPPEMTARVEAARVARTAEEERLRQLEVDMAIKNDVVLLVQLARPDVFVPHIDIRNMPLVQRVAQPADGVGIRPGHPHSQTRYGSGMTRHVRRRSHGHEVESELRSGVVNGLRETCLGGQNPRPGRIIFPTHIE